MVSIAFLTGCTSAPPPLPQPDTLSSSAAKQLSDLELEAYAEQALSENPGMTLPKVSTIRFIHPTEQGQIHAECLREEGFEAIATEDGGIEVGYPVEQRPSFAVSLYICAAKYPTDPKYLAGFNESQNRYLYYFMTTELVPCLEDAGFNIEVPSLQAFLDNVGTSDQWVPMESVGPAGFASVEDRCPQLPENYYEVFFGD